MKQRFVAWDGEGYQGKYVLLQSSDGDHVFNRGDLSTLQCFELLLSSEAAIDAINIWFGFGYDVCSILRDIPLERLYHLYHYGQISWNGYSITYIPRKNFGVKRKGEAHGFFSYDTWGFFQSSFISALEDWKIPVPEVIRIGKAARSDFSRWSEKRLREYNGAECKLLVELMERLRESLKVANLKIYSWDGAGTLAAAWMKREDVKRFYPKQYPPGFERVLRCAYFGGRIDVAAVGKGKAFAYDLNSAYPAALTHVPDMSRLRWKRVQTKKRPSHPYAIVRVRWRLPRSSEPGRFRLWNPLPWRDKTESVMFPDYGEGWYHNVELEAADKLFGTDWRQVQAAWIPSGPISCPLAEPIRRDYAIRKQWKKEGNAAQIPLRLALNAIYGKCQQRSFRGKRWPKFRNYFWSGYCTAWTRARLLDVVRKVGDPNVLAMATDGVVTTKPLPNADSDELGRWKKEELERAVIAGAGMYQGYKPGEEKPSKVRRRGIGSSSVDYEEILDYWTKHPFDAWTQKMQLFIGIGLAWLTNKYREYYAKFVTIEKHLVPLWMGNEKRFPIVFNGPIEFKDGWAYVPPATLPNHGASKPYIEHTHSEQLLKQYAEGEIPWTD